MVVLSFSEHVDIKLRWFIERLVVPRSSVLAASTLKMFQAVVACMAAQEVLKDGTTLNQRDEKNALMLEFYRKQCVVFLESTLAGIRLPFILTVDLLMKTTLIGQKEFVADRTLWDLYLNVKRSLHEEVFLIWKTLCPDDTTPAAEDLIRLIEELNRQLYVKSMEQKAVRASNKTNASEPKIVSPVTINPFKQQLTSTCHRLRVWSRMARIS